MHPDPRRVVCRRMEFDTNGGCTQKGERGQIKISIDIHRHSVGVRLQGLMVRSFFKFGETHFATGSSRERMPSQRHNSDCKFRSLS